MTNPHIPDLSTLEKKLGTDLSEGLPVREAKLRLEKSNKNGKEKSSVFVAHKRHAWTAFLTFASSPYAILLLITSLLTALFGKTVIGWSVFAVTLAATAFGGVLALYAQRTFDSMGEYASPMVKVKRGGNIFYTDGRNLQIKGNIQSGEKCTFDLSVSDGKLILTDHGIPFDQLK